MGHSPQTVNIEVIDELWLVWSPERGYWTLQKPGSDPGELHYLGARILTKGTFITFIWPEAT